MIRNIAQAALTDAANAKRVRQSDIGYHVSLSPTIAVRSAQRCLIPSTRFVIICAAPKHFF
jgi:hypothetical protein